MLCNWGCISYVKSRAMALNLVEYKSPVQNVIAYARIACLLFCFGWQIPRGGDKRREQMPHPRDIVAYVLNAKYIITTIFLGHVSVL